MTSSEKLEDYRLQAVSCRNLWKSRRKRSATLLKVSGVFSFIAFFLPLAIGNLMLAFYVHPVTVCFWGIFLMALSHKLISLRFGPNPLLQTGNAWLATAVVATGAFIVGPVLGMLLNQDFTWSALAHLLVIAAPCAAILLAVFFFAEAWHAKSLNRAALHGW